MSRGSIRPLAAVAAAVLLTFVGLLLAAHWAVSQKAVCALPCRDLSRCQPLELSLELAAPAAPMNKRYTLWYRATVKNVSCFVTESITLGSLMRGTGYLKLRIWDPTGALVEPIGEPGWGNRTEFGDVFPFADTPPRPGPGVSVREDPGYTWLRLIPGGTVSTGQSELHPHRLSLGPAQDGPNRGTAEYVSPAKTDARPGPAGYLVLNEYLFTRPGTYRIQAIFEESCYFSPIYPYEHYVPPSIQRILSSTPAWRLGLWRPYERKEVRVRAESSIQEFRVK